MRSHYGGLDRIKLAMAFVVVAIHTGPLTGISPQLDFVWTHVAARVAVPFFLMVSGFFLLRAYLFGGKTSPGPLLKTLGKLGLLYLLATILYLPLNGYAGHFSGITPARLMQMLVFDGTFYHLWYFPAVMLGLGLVFWASQVMKPPVLLGLCLALYGLGLLGDSYYGLGQHLPGVSHFYQLGFWLFSYARNGFLYAPVFLVLGAWLSAVPLPAKKWALPGLGVCFVLLIWEGLTVQRLSLARHDSMYVALVPTMYFLFSLALGWRAVPSLFFRNCATWIYILHPWCIVLVRGLAKVSKGRWLLVDNPLVHYLAVCLVSFALAAGVARFLGRHTKKPAKQRAWIEVDETALANNVACIQAGLPLGCQLMAAVKANAYGHGDVRVARALGRLGVRHFCVASLEEGIRLRKNKIRGEILILGYTPPGQFAQLQKYKLSQTAVDYAHAQALNAWGKPLQVHLAVDTGMHRLGEHAQNLAAIEEMLAMKNLRVQGLFSHLCVSDSARPRDINYTHAQCKALWEVAAQLRQKGLHCPPLHLLSSYGALQYPQYAGDLARVGISLYGVFSRQEELGGYADKLQPVLSLKSRITCVKTLQAGERAGYGLAFAPPGASRIAMISIGYADGLPRALSGGVGQVLVQGRKVPIAGRVCMDQTMIDITGLEDVQPGDEVVLIGSQQGQTISAYEIAHQCGTITNEIFSRLGSRLERA